mmetsp:Transcript_9379/g.12337  ORF Transcript_9379/g.12337 Transcript_9379/m.12337 type:complete len:292 (+) Transcript_9379:97-972(+)
MCATAAGKKHAAFPKKSGSKSQLVGNMLHAISLINVCTFALCVVLFAHGDSPVFDKLWTKEGFCVANSGMNYWTSHDLCLYADLSLAGIIGILVTCLRSQEGMGSANDLVSISALMGIVGHGIGHGALAYNQRTVTTEDSLKTANDVDNFSLKFLFRALPFLFFWFGLLKASMKNVSNLRILFMSILSLIALDKLPDHFGFTFVQTVLMVAFSFDQLSRPKEDKDYAYALYAALVSLPVGMIGWIESLQCTNFVINYGGHLIYDAYIPFGIILFYLTCYVRARNMQKVKMV